jgi:hypothetical protein
MSCAVLPENRAAAYDCPIAHLTVRASLSRCFRYGRKRSGKWAAQLTEPGVMVR